jgi:hypothetical protein
MEILFEQHQRSPLVARALRLRSGREPSGNYRSYIYRDRQFPRKGELAKVQISMARIAELNDQLKQDVKRDVREAWKGQVKCALRAHKLIECGNSMIRSSIGLTLFYEILESRMMMKRGRLDEDDDCASLYMDVSQLPPNLAWLVGEETVFCAI